MPARMRGVEGVLVRMWRVAANGATYGFCVFSPDALA